MKLVEKLGEYEFYFKESGEGVFPEPVLSACAPDIIPFSFDNLQLLSIDSVKAYQNYIKDQLLEIEGAQTDLFFEGYLAPRQEKQVKEYCALVDKCKELVDEILYYIDNLLWLLERFPDGVYRDVIGLCKAAKLDGEDGIIDQDYSLNAGRYVGVVIEDDGMTEVEFKETMLGLNAEFEALNDEAKKLEAEIAENIKRLLMK